MAGPSDVEVKFGADTEGVKRGAKDVESSIDGLKSRVESISNTFRTLGEIIGISLSVQAVKSFIESMANLGLETERTAAQLGLTAEKVGEISGVAALTGTSMEGLTLGIERMSLGIQRSTRDATNPIAQSLKVLGLNAKDLIGIPTEQYFIKVADAVAKFNPSLNLSNALMTIGGRGFSQMIPLLVQGGSRFREFEEAVRRTGATLSDAQAGAFARTHEKLTLLGMSIQGIGITIFSKFEPAIDTMLNGLTQLFEGINGELKQNDLLQISLQLVVYALDAVLAIVLTLAAGFVTLWETVSAAVEIVGSAIGRLARAATDAAKGDFTAAANDIKAAWDGAGKSIDDYKAKVVGIGAGYTDLLQQLFGIGGKLPPATITTGRKEAGAIDFGGPPAPPNPFETALADAGKQLSALKAQTAALGMGAQAAIEYTTAERLRAVAIASGIALTERDKIAIDAQAQAIGARTVELQHAQSVQQALQDLAHGITSAFMSWIDGTKNLGVAFLRLAAQIAEAALEALILDAILSALGLALPTTGLGQVFAPIFGGGRAEGGPLEQGKWYIAGEKGPEPIWGGGPGSFAQGYPQQAAPNITYAPSIQALDSSGVDTVLASHGDKFAKHIARLFSKQPSLRPSY